MLGRCFLVLLFASLLAACFTLTAQESKRSGPETTVADRPADVTAKTSAVFRFSGGEGTVTFKCKLDGEEWKNCNSPLYLNKLKEGTHKLSVAAVDKDGNADSTPAVVSWKIDATPPVSKIQSAPKKVTGKKSASFSFSANEKSTFKCKIDGGEWKACNSPFSVSGLEDGEHTFSLFAVDSVLNPEKPEKIFKWTVDLTPPESFIDRGPAPLSNSKSVEFVFSSKEKGVKFFCRLDGGNYEACSSPKRYSSPSEGTHKFYLVSEDRFANREQTPKSYAFDIDLSAPETTINKGPEKRTAEKSASFEYYANEKNVTYRCSIDREEEKVCRDKSSYTDLSDGTHLFSAAAVDSAGNRDASPATFEWRIDTVKPKSEIVETPKKLSNSRRAVFSFKADKKDSTFQCRLDEGAWERCVGKKGYGNLKEGTHTFLVRAVDDLGNREDEPSKFEFTVDLTAPGSKITSAPEKLTGNRDAEILFSSNDKSARFECSLDGEKWSSCDKGNYKNLPEGSHTFRVRAIDAAGNVEKSLTSHVWEIDITPPATEIKKKPEPRSNMRSVSFEFDANEKVREFQCRLGESDFRKCERNMVFRDVIEGKHVLSVRALDLVGNMDKTPATYEFLIDRTPPKTTISRRPESPSAKREALFQFESSKKGSTFRCSLDGAPFSVCLDRPLYKGLKEGEHKLRVRSVDDLGNREKSPAEFSWIVDLTPPDTKIDEKPAEFLSAGNVEFSFSSSEEGSRFECSFDGTKWSTCISPKSYKGLKEGKHVFHVRAIDRAGNVESDPGRYSFTTDLTAPDTRTSIPVTGLTNKKEVLFSYSSTEKGTVFECSVDSKIWKSCGETTTLKNLGEGETILLVRSRDRAGNLDPTPLRFSRMVDHTAPTTEFLNVPKAVSNSARAGFEFEANEPARGFICSADGSPFTDCVSGYELSDLKDGDHTFVVKAIDRAGNTQIKGETHKWSIDTVAPETEITTKPASISSKTEALFIVKPSEKTRKIECALDRGAWKSCNIEHFFKNLKEGEHAARFRSTDIAGNVEKTAAAFKWQVDITPPDTSAKKVPPVLTNKRAARFLFGSNEKSSFECKMDNEPWKRCDADSLFKVNEGRHSLSVRAKDGAGNIDPEPFLHVWEVDRTAAKSSIMEKPKSLTNVTSASFSFSSTEKGSSFQCRVDGGKWSECKTPFDIKALEDGTHSFGVRSIDRAGNLEAKGALYSWKIDTVPPVSKIVKMPESLGSATDALFTFTPSEKAREYKCRIDKSAWTPCSTDHKLKGLPEGRHTFTVKATDMAGNEETAGASYSWIVDTTPPTTRILKNPSPIVNTRDASFSFRSSETVSRHLCRLNEGKWRRCQSPAIYKKLKAGKYAFSVKAVDMAGNRENNPPVARWMIDLNPPKVTLKPVISELWNSSKTSFAFEVDEEAVFSCRMDGDEWKSCRSPFEKKSVKDGLHTFSVYAEDRAGNRSRTESFRFTVDTLAPKTFIVAGPTGLVNKNEAAFTFNSSEPGHFLFRLDGGEWEKSDSKQIFKSLAQGDHKLEVAAVDKAGNRDPKAVKRQWKVDTVAPVTTLRLFPPQFSKNPNVKFKYSTNEPGAGFECRIGRAPWNSCKESVTLFKLADGKHTFRVRSFDRAGNFEKKYPRYTFTVDTVAPTTTIVEKPADLGNRTEAAFSFKSTEEATFKCSVDEKKWKPCDENHNMKDLKEGLHKLRVRSIDLAGNEEPKSVSYNWIVDLTPPDTTIFRKPAEISPERNAEFEFRSNETTRFFHCRIDGGKWRECDGKRSYRNLKDGTHKFEVRARDNAGNLDDTPSAYIFSVDTVSPVSKIETAPDSLVNTREAKFTFSANEEGSTFICSVDGGDFAPCRGEKDLKSLVEGEHTFAVAAIDRAGNREKKFQLHKWTIDLTPPDTEIKLAPEAATNETNATFSFTSTEKGGFEYQLDSGKWENCSRNLELKDLKEGNHILKIRSVDEAGNTDPTPDLHSWKVDLTPPVAKMGKFPPKVNIEVNAEFSFTSNEKGSTFICKLDDENWVGCKPPVRFDNLGEGKHLFSVKAVDISGNVSSEAADYDWIIPLQFDGVSNGYQHTCSLGKSRLAYCWGNNAVGQLGDRSDRDRNLPKPVRMKGYVWSRISSGKHHTCGIGGVIGRGDRKLYCWGSNGNGELGTGNRKTVRRPTEVAGGHNDWITVSSSYHHTCAIRDEGGKRPLYCFGGNGWGQLGIAGKKRVVAPMKVSSVSDGWLSVSTGYFHTCGIRNEGDKRKLYCTGSGSDGQLGNGNREKKVFNLTEVGGGYDDWLSVSAGYYHTCGVRADGGKNSLYCWGYNNNGQLADGSGTTRLSPVPVTGNNRGWKKVSSGFNYTCGIREESGQSNLYCWGYNQHSQLGDGSYFTKVQPVSVAGGYHDWVEISTGERHSCAIRQKSGRYQLYCWGDNFSGQVGDGTNELRSVPTEISGEIVKKNPAK